MVTGDQVRLTNDQGRPTATILPAAHRIHEPAFETITTGSGSQAQLYVYPSDAVEQVGDRLDPELFNVTKLLDYGYTDGVPVIVTGSSSGAAGLAGAGSLASAGVSATRALPSVDGLAMTITAADEWWAANSSQAPGVRTTGTAAGGPAGKVWLDELAEVTLDASVPQVGAPAAWDAGYDGTGLTVAVLDTGIDADHPDLAGKVLQVENFTEDPNATDEHGHGTHVAGIIAGTGAASAGDHSGVAPGANLLSGKICDATGSCPTSAIIAGMEWAAQRADVVNLSVGTNTGSDGTDPASQAVNTLTAEHDTLFVISAGNVGWQGDGSVGSPGAADAALTVGSVGKDDFLAGDSSRGPRLGDYAIKPDLTAPGVGIVAPLADGVTFGNPVGDFYAAESGTSMAAPHVAGAVAILRQQDPTAGAEQLKAALVGTAAPDPQLNVYHQGGGRLDVGAAVAAPVQTTPALLDFGYFPHPQDDTEPVSAELTYTNRTDSAVTLDLSLEVTSRDGGVPAGPALSVSPDTLMIEPGESAAATVVLAVSAGEIGLYGGYLQASVAGEVVTRTPVGYFQEGELYDLTVTGTTRDGRPAGGASSFHVMEVHDASQFLQGNNSFGDGTTTLRVPPGVYHVMGLIYTYDENNEFFVERTLVGEVEVEVAAATTVELDARPSVPLVVDTPAHPEAVASGASKIGFSRTAAGSGELVVNTASNWLPTYLVPTDPVTVGEFEVQNGVRLHAPGVMYDLVLPEPDRIPAELTYLVHTDDLATLDSRVHSSVEGQVMGEIRHYWRPHDLFSVGVVNNIVAPLQRTEYLVGGDTRYRREVAAAAPFTSTMFEQTTTYQAGEHRDESWFRSPVRPGVLEDGPEEAGEPAVREGDTLRLMLPEWQDSHPGHWGWFDGSVDTSEFRLYQDGELVVGADRPRGEFELSPGPAEYRLEVELARQAEWWTTSTQTRTGWTIQSQRPTDDDPELVPLLLVDYDVAVDLSNTAESTFLQSLDLRVRHQPGVSDPPRVHRVRVSISFDEGQTWRQRPALPRGDAEFTVLLPPFPPADAESVSLRVVASDRDGNSVEQEVTRAWLLP